MNLEPTHSIGISETYIMETVLKYIEEERLFLDNKFHESNKQWDELTKSDLIVTILNKYMFPSIAIVKRSNNNGFTYEFVIDGIQRLKTCLDFRNNKFPINENSEHTIISYQTNSKNEKGEIVYSIKECDLRGKFYTELPKEIQNIFNMHNIKVDLYANCSDEDIKYHTNRYNHKIGE